MITIIQRHVRHTSPTIAPARPTRTGKLVRPRINALTVDVEDYYQVEAFSGIVQREHWSAWESRVERNTFRLLELFARRDVRATFFVLGWIADHHPRLVREIVAAGHEVACHGYQHRLIYRQTPAEFRGDVRRARCRLEDIVGAPVEGYRAPTYSITAASLWALDVLIDEGFRYDCSIFPIHHDRYGIPGAPRFPYRILRAGGDIAEFPPSTLAVWGASMPLTGGGYFRLLPYPIFAWGWRHINRHDLQPAIFVVHPWEVDPEQPVIPAGHFTTWRHRFNLHRTMPRLETLLGEFCFAPVREVLWTSLGSGRPSRVLAGEQSWKEAAPSA